MRCLVRFRYEDHPAELISIFDGRATVLIDGFSESSTFPLANIVEAGSHLVLTNGEVCGVL